LAVERGTEATGVPFLIEELKGRGVKVDEQVSYVLIDGKRQQPDAKFLNGGVYYLEAETGAKSKLFDGLKQAYDYRKFLSATGAFAVLFPRPAVRCAITDADTMRLRESPCLRFPCRLVSHPKSSSEDCHLFRGFDMLFRAFDPSVVHRKSRLRELWETVP